MKKLLRELELRKSISRFFEMFFDEKSRFLTLLSLKIVNALETGTIDKYWIYKSKFEVKS